MGKLAIFLVLALSLSVGVVGYNMNRSKTFLVTNVSGFEKYTTARNIAHTGVNLLLRRLDRNDSTLITPLSTYTTAWMISNVMSGICSVSVQLTNPPALDTIDIRSKATYIDSSYLMKVRLYRHPVPFPGVNAAVNLAAPSIDFSMNGAPTIDGRNWDMNGNLNPDRTTDTNGVSVMGTAESTSVAIYDAKITGDPQQVTTQTPPDPGIYVPQYISAADINFPDGSVNSGNYGSPAAPVIGYVNGDVQFSGTGSFYGILLVHGSITFSGTFDFYGLVIAYGDNNTICLGTSAGTPRIYGAIIETGPPGSNFVMKGTSDIRYSVEALRMSMYINKLQAYRVMRWYE